MDIPTFPVPDWNVLCEGPSVLDVTVDDLLPGAPVVAVNMALVLADRLPVLVWASQDDPRTVKDFYDGPGCDRKHSLKRRTCVWDIVKRHLPDRPIVVWGQQDHRDEWLALAIPRADGEPTLPPGTRIELGRAVEDETFPWRPKVYPPGIACNWTTMSAIANCVLRGARRIRLFGADMRGSGNVFTHFDEVEDKVHADRWKKERADMERTREACEVHGVTLERWGYDE